MLKTITSWIRGENSPETSGRGEASVPQTARHWYFNKRPKDVIEDDTLVLREDPVPALKDGEILVRSLYMSLDATNRVWLSDWDTRDRAFQRGHAETDMPSSPHPKGWVNENDRIPALTAWEAAWEE